MARVALLLCAVIILAAVSGCVELGRRKVGLAPEIIGDGVRVRKPGIVSSRQSSLANPRLSGIEGFYRVRKTDTLVSIAQRFYGDASYVRELSDGNRDVLAEAGGLKRGMVIVLPKVAQHDDALPPEMGTVEDATRRASTDLTGAAPRGTPLAPAADAATAPQTRGETPAR